MFFLFLFPFPNSEPLMFHFQRRPDRLQRARSCVLARPTVTDGGERTCCRWRCLRLPGQSIGRSGFFARDPAAQQHGSTHRPQMNPHTTSHVADLSHTSSINLLPRLPSNEAGVSLLENVALVPAVQGGEAGDRLPLAFELAVVGLITYGPP